MANLSISLDTSKVDEALEKMQEQLENFPKDMGEELTKWQTDDMRRRFPNTTVDDQSATTDIWPTSRLTERDRSKIKATLKASGKPVTHGVRVKTNRPILREELYEKLKARMDKLLSEKLSWQ
jgi:hypothetical protein